MRLNDDLDRPAGERVPENSRCSRLHSTRGSEGSSSAAEAADITGEAVRDAVLEAAREGASEAPLEGWGTAICCVNMLLKGL